MRRGAFWRRGKRAAELLAALLATAWCCPLWAEDADEELQSAFHGGSAAKAGGQDQKAQAPKPGRRTGMILRLGGEVSSVWPATWVYGERTDQTVTSQFSYFSGEAGLGLGGRFLLGLGIAWPAGVAVVPHVLGSVHAVAPQTTAIAIAGSEHRWTIGYTYWSLGGGCEVELLQRMLVLGLGIGAAGLVPEAWSAQTPGLALRDPAEVLGPMGQVNVGLRFPQGFPWGGGVNLGLEGFLINIFQPPAVRLAAGVFVEFDTTRLK